MSAQSRERALSTGMVGAPLSQARAGRRSRLDFDTRAATFSRALPHLDHAATRELDRVEFDPRLRDLVRTRVSQLNGCASCVDMHTKDARKAGETDNRLTGLPVWRETAFFEARERPLSTLPRPSS